jgi:integrase/recombinase XerC/integrase/recombinase XerD
LAALNYHEIKLATLAENYLTTCQTEGKTPKTLRGYREKLFRFIRWFDGQLSDFSLQRAREFVAHLQRTEKWVESPARHRAGEMLSPQSVANHVRVLKAFATWLWEEGYTQENLLSRMSLPKVPRKMIEVLSNEEIDRLLASIDLSLAAGSRDLALITLMLDTGLRLAELIALRVDDVYFEDQWLKVMGKGQKERFVPFGGRAAQVLLRYVHHGRYDPFGRPEFFLTSDGEAVSENTIKMLFVRLRRRSGIRRLHPHLLRHTFATSYLVAGGDVFTLQAILGHTTLEMTRRYVSLASSQVNIQHRRFSPMDRLDTPALRLRRGRPDAGPRHSARGAQGTELGAFVPTSRRPR